VNWYSPGCFNCKNPVQWPPPQTEDQARLQQHAAAVFQEQLTAWRAAQPAEPAAAPPPPPPPQASQRVPAVSGVALPPIVDANPASLIESTHFAPVPVESMTRETVEGFSTGTFGAEVPAGLATSRMDDLEGTKVEQLGPSVLGGSDQTAEPVERTSFDAVDAGVVAPAPDLDLASFSSVTAQVTTTTVEADPLMERTALQDHVRAVPAVKTGKKKVAAAGTRICKDCGTVSDRTRCPVCGAMTKELSA